MSQFHSFVAMGDSFTEGMSDVGPNGGYRGWADLVADRLTETNASMTYANLAVRGRLFDAVVDDQIPAALRLRPDLVSFAAGGNDALRPSFQPAKMASRLHEAVRVLTASGATVILLTSSAVNNRLPAPGFLRGRFAAFNEIIRKVGARHDSVVVDLWKDDSFNDPRLWCRDRLHMSTLGHQRVADHVCQALKIDSDPQWHESSPPVDTEGWLARRRSDATWARTYLAPWVHRRLTGRSSGDSVKAKRPRPLPLHSESSSWSSS